MGDYENHGDKIVYKWPQTGRLEIKITGMRSAVIKFKPKVLNREAYKSCTKGDNGNR